MCKRYRKQDTKIRPYNTSSQNSDLITPQSSLNSFQRTSDNLFKFSYKSIEKQEEKDEASWDSSQIGETISQLLGLSIETKTPERPESKFKRVSSLQPSIFRNSDQLFGDCSNFKNESSCEKSPTFKSPSPKAAEPEFCSVDVAVPIIYSTSIVSTLPRHENYS